MAFNPFSWFRDHQKGVMIGLIGLCMVIFIFQFGQGDAFTRVLQAIGATRASGEVVATLYGKKVREGDISKIAQRRKAASDFLYNTVSKGHEEVSKELSESIEAKAKGRTDLKETPAFAGMRNVLQAYQSNWSSYRTLRQFGNDPRMAGFLQQEQMKLDEYIQKVGSRLRSLEEAASKPDLDKDERFVFQQIATLLGFQVRAMTVSTANPFYFGGGTRTEDILDFRLWQLQADRLGIHLTDADVIKEIVAETAGSTKVFDPEKPFADQESVKAFIGVRSRDKSNAYSAADLMDSLREEFRVVIAQGALLGVEPGVRSYRAEMTTSATPSLATPDEFYDYYREMRTAVSVKLFPITAESYLSQVKGEPTEIELQARYERGAKFDPMPYGREPGFRQPRRAKIEYVFASPEDPFYKKKAEEDAATLKKLGHPLVRLFAVMGFIPSPGLANAYVLACDPLAKDFDSALAQDHAWFGDMRDEIPALEKRRDSVHTSTIMDPASMASLFAGSYGGPSISGLVTTRSLWYFQEVRQSAPFNLHMMLAQSDPQNLLGAAAMAVQSMPAQTPRTLLEPQILAAKEKSLAEGALRANFATIESELQKLGKKPAEAKAAEVWTAAVRAYISKAVQEYKLGIRSMPAVRSPNELFEDLKNKKNALDLEPLRAAVMNIMTRGVWKLSENKPGDTQAFVNYLFQDKRSEEGKPPETGPYVVMRGGNDPETKQEFFFWRSDDVKGEERKFSEVRAAVVAAWRLDQARTLARNQAEELEAKINKKKETPPDAERFLKEQKLAAPFELEKVSQLTVPALEVHAMVATDYQGYQVPEDKFDVFPYPPQDFAKQVTKLTRLGEATVIVDRPAKTFYVALLVDRKEPELAAFRKVYANSPGSDRLYMFLQFQRREEYRKAVMEQLRREASADLDKDGRFKLPESIRKNDPSQYESE